MPVLKTAGEWTLRLACREGRQDQRHTCAVIDAFGRYRLAHAAEDLAAIEGRISLMFVDFTTRLGFPFTSEFVKEYPC